MSRRSRDGIVLDNVGGTSEAAQYAETKPVVQRDGTDRNLAHASIVMLDRVLFRLLRNEVRDLVENQEKTERLLLQFFDATVLTEEIGEWVEYVTVNPPTVTMGYPRSTARFPCFSIVMEGEEESMKFVGNYAGTKLGDAPGDDADYVGSMFDQSLAVYIYDHNPDGVAMLYHLAKMIVLAGSDALTASGAMDLHLSGGDLSPQEAYIPVDMFARRLLVGLKSTQTVERLRRQPRASRVTVSGVHASDVVVDGRRGGVHHSPHECDDE